MHRLSTDTRFAGVVVFKIDFDSGKEHLRRLKVQTQGTLIGFKGATETARSVGEVDPDALRAVFEATL